MEFAVDCLTLGVDQLEGVRSVAVHVTVTVGSATITEQEEVLVNGFRAQGHEVPEHVGVLQMRSGVTLLGVNEAVKFYLT